MVVIVDDDGCRGAVSEHQTIFDEARLQKQIGALRFRRQLSIIARDRVRVPR